MNLIISLFVLFCKSQQHNRNIYFVGKRIFVQFSHLFYEFSLIFFYANSFTFRANTVPQCYISIIMHINTNLYSKNDIPYSKTSSTPILNTFNIYLDVKENKHINHFKNVFAQNLNGHNNIY